MGSGEKLLRAEKAILSSAAAAVSAFAKQLKLVTFLRRGYKHG
jgi:hypothetical protein